MTRASVKTFASDVHGSQFTYEHLSISPNYIRNSKIDIFFHCIFCSRKNKQSSVHLKIYYNWLEYAKHKAHILCMWYVCSVYFLWENSKSWYYQMERKMMSSKVAQLKCFVLCSTIIFLSIQRCELWSIYT